MLQKSRFKTSVFHWGRNALHTAVNIVIPPVCALCRADLGDEYRCIGFCQDCRSLLTGFGERYCARCGNEYDSHRQETNCGRNGCCPRCKQQKFQFSAVFALGPYQSHVRRAVLQTKHPQGYPLAVALGRLLAQTQKKDLEVFHPDMVIAIPTHWWRRFQRGAYGPDAIAESVAKYLGIPKASRWIIRSRHTTKQVTLPQTRRKRNLENAFRLIKKEVSGKRILLIDDVMTTGTTCNEVARIFQSNGARDVAVAVVARQGLNTMMTQL